MACHISVRDIDFHPSETGVRIRVTTDVPSHLFVRLSLREPWVHMQPSIRRGVAFAEDVRFCFTVFEDNEQFELGDTLEHTWWKKNWPVCTTKWLYVWGMRAGETCVSTTAPFKYHNDGVSPVTPPTMLRAFTTVEPNLVSVGTPNAWEEIDLSGLVDENASGVLLHWRQTAGATYQFVGARKPGAAGQFTGISRLGGQSWLISGLSPDKKFLVRTSADNTGEFWLMGYFNQYAHFLDEAIERVPNPAGWTSIDWSDVLPEDAIAGLFLVGNTSSILDEYGIRPFGSTRDTRTNGIANTAIIKLNTRVVDFGKISAGVETRFRNSCIGYLTAGYIGETEGIEISPPVFTSWRDINLVHHFLHPQLVIIEWATTTTFNPMGAKKWKANHSYAQTGDGHAWPMIHPHDPGKIQLYRQAAEDHFYLMGSLN